MGADLAGGDVTILRLAVVNYTPNSLEVIGPDILVLQVVGVLPDVHPNDGDVGLWCDIEQRVRKYHKKGEVTKSCQNNA